jgi:predicted phosphate transport protein (TIGR00153 family)
MRLFPRDEKFFDLLVAQATHMVDAAKLLHEALKVGTHAEMARTAGAIQRVENEADEITHQLFKRLNSTFVTPLDPEDLHALGSSIDDVIDYIEDGAFRLVAYRIEPPPHSVTELTGNSLLACERLLAAVTKLRDGKSITEDCIEINRLENIGDEIFRRLLTELFDSVTDAATLLKHKDIYEVLEAATDRCEDAADVLQAIQVKNS